MSNHVRQPALSAPRKRKERDSPDTPAAAAPPKAEPVSASASAPPAPAGNRLLAGYLAHEFLTKGTLLGQRWDPTSTPTPTPTPNPARPEPERAKPLAGSYADVARLMWADGVHVPGVVNPTQLAHWLQM